MAFVYVVHDERAYTEVMWRQQVLNYVLHLHTSPVAKAEVLN